MRKKRHGCKEQKSSPLCRREPHCLERRHKSRLLRHQDLQRKSHSQCEDHQWVIHRIHPKYSFFHIPHSHCVEKLGQPQNRERVRLAVG